MTREARAVAKRCGICKSGKPPLSPCEGSYVCEPCLQRANNGRDVTTRAARATRFGMHQRATALRYERNGEVDAAAPHRRSARELAEKADALWALQPDAEMLTGGVAPTKPWLATAQTKAPDIVALEATAHRLELLDRMGSDCVALALDAAESGDSREVMLCHQLAVAHQAILDIMGKAVFEPDSVGQARLLNVAARLMDSFQRGQLVLQRLQTGGEQTIVVRNVTVGEGGRPSSAMSARGGRKNDPLPHAPCRPVRG